MFCEKEFNIMSFIGEGKFARVSLAIKDNCKYVFRTLKLTESAGVSSRKLICEAKTLAKICHPNIVKCYGLLLGQMKSFVMEYCFKSINDGFEDIIIHSLLGLLRTMEDLLAVDIRLKALIDITNALSFLHDKNIVAGDIKPSNVLVAGGTTETFVFKLSDFSNETLKRHDQSMLGSSCGSSKEFTYTLFYLAPELIQENFDVTAKITSQTDMFAFSILAYETLFPEVPLPTYPSPWHHMQALKSNWRPQIPNMHKIPPSAIEILESSWDESPGKRISAYAANKKLSDVAAKVNWPVYFLLIFKDCLCFSWNHERLLLCTCQINFSKWVLNQAST